MRRFLQLKIAVAILAVGIVSCGGGNDAAPANALTATPNKANWDKAAVNQLAGKKDIIITNTSDKDITGINYYLERKQSSIFLVGSDCTEVIPAKGTCKVSVDFIPDLKGKTYSDKYVFEYDAKTGKSIASINLSGNTLQATGEPTDIDGLLIINAEGEASTWKYKDTISAPVGVTSNEVYVAFRWTKPGISPLLRVIEKNATGEFIVRNACTAHLATNDVCNVYFSFTPATEEEVTSTYTIRALKDDGSAAKELILTIKGKGETPSTSTDITMTSDGDSFTSKTPVGEISTEERTITISNNTDKTLYNRVVSTSNVFHVNHNTCTGVLRAKGTDGDSCTVKVKHSPSKVGVEQAYIRTIAGSKTSFVKFSGEGSNATASTGTLSYNATKLVFPNTEDGFISATKRITFKATASDNTTISFKLSDNKYIQTYRYTTTCAPNDPLPQDETCSIDIAYAPVKKVGAAADPNIGISLQVNIKSDTSTLQIPLTLEGKMIDKQTGNLETPIPNVTVSTKRYNFPDTAVGLPSTALLVKITNNGTEDIKGFRSTSTDLVNFPLVKDLTDCGSVILAGKDCNIAYQFIARSTVPRTAYISVWSEGVEEDNQIIQIAGRGSLFNKYLSFGYVNAATGEQKILSMAYVNDTKILQKISKVELEGFTTTWNWNPAVDSFIDSEFTNSTLTTNNPFSIVSNDCVGRDIASGQSCIIRVQFDSTKTAGGASDKNTYRAYITLKDSVGKVLEFEDENNGNKTYVVGKFHATASTTPNTIMYFPADNSDPTAPYKPYTYIGNTTTAFGEKVYAIGGAPDVIEVGDDLDLKVYDASRNMWKKLKPDGKSPLKYYDARYTTMSALPAAFVNSKLYLFSGGLTGTGVPNLRTQDLFVYDPNDTKVSPDGSWKKLPYTYTDATKAQPLPTSRYATYGAALKGHIFSFSGANGNNGNILSEFLVIDVRDEDRVTMVNLEEKAPTAEKPYPKPRTSAAITAYNDKIYLHGGNIINTTQNDLWEYTPVFDETGKITRDGTWKCLYADDNGSVSPILRPSARMQHKLLPINKKLFISGTGFEWKTGTGLVPVADANKIYFEVLLDNFSDAVGATSYAGFKQFKIADDNDFNKLGREVTGKLSGHTTVSVEGTLWFHNVNIMGLFIEAK